MEKMSMIWIVVALEIFPKTNSKHLIKLETIKFKVKQYWGNEIANIMVSRHLVSWKDQDRDRTYPKRGGSPNRYLFQIVDGFNPNFNGDFRLYKEIDKKFDGEGKIGEIHPDLDDIMEGFPSSEITAEELIKWYCETYFHV